MQAWDLTIIGTEGGSEPREAVSFHTAVERPRNCKALVRGSEPFRLKRRAREPSDAANRAKRMLLTFPFEPSGAFADPQRH